MWLHLMIPMTRRAERDRRVEGAARDAADRERPGRDGEADGEAVERVALGAPRGGHVEDHVGEGEREEELDEEDLADAGGRAACRRR